MFNPYFWLPSPSFLRFLNASPLPLAPLAVAGFLAAEADVAIFLLLKTVILEACANSAPGGALEGHWNSEGDILGSRGGVGGGGGGQGKQIGVVFLKYVFRI